MKSGFVLSVCCILCSIYAMGQDQMGKRDSVEVIQDFKNLYRYQHYYIGGQPTYEALNWLKANGVKRIINLRSEKENTDFAGMAYDEVKTVRDAGLEYFSVPIDGTKDYTPENLAALANLLANNDKVLIHCASGVRATDFLMAYLVKNKGFTVNEAVEVGRRLKFSLPLEKLLDCKIVVTPVR